MTPKNHPTGNTAKPVAPYLLGPHRPGDIGWVISRRGALYARAVSRPKCNTRVIGLRAQLDESRPGFERRPATA